MKLDNLVVTLVLLTRFELLVLWFVVECGHKGHCHDQLDEQRLSFSLVVQKLVCVCINSQCTSFDLGVEMVWPRLDD
jgi:hypothetical protein